MESLQEAQPTFLDYKVREFGVLGARKKNELQPDDIVSDESGFIGIVRFVDEKRGNWIEFVDGVEGYDKQLKLKLKTLSLKNAQFFNHQKNYYGKITAMARVIKESIKGSFPASNAFFNGKEIFVRGSTLAGITKKFTAARVTKSHSLLAIKLTPFFNFELQTFDVAVQKRGQSNRFAFNILRDMFVDIDLKVTQSNRFRYIINDPNEYNEFHWLRIRKMFRKFNLKYTRI